MYEINPKIKHIFILACLAYIFFILGNGLFPLSNPDEVFYSQTAKEMSVRSSWSTPYLFGQPNFEKPIFLYWLLRLGFILFGVSSFAARFFPAIFASIGAIAVYFIGVYGFKDRRKAFFCSLVMMSSSLYIGLARTVFTDMIFSVWILLALGFFIWGYLKRKHKGLGLILFFVCSAFAVLTKGPLGLCVPLFTVFLFLFLNRQLKYFFCLPVLWGVLAFSLIALPWYIEMFSKYNKVFFQEFFYNDHYRRMIEAEHKANDTWRFYPFATIGGMFPWSLFLVGSFVGFFKNSLYKKSPLLLFAACWITAAFLIFQPNHSKLVSYIFPLFPALALLAGDYAWERINNKENRIFRRIFILTWYIFVLIVLALLAVVIFYKGLVSSKAPLYCFIIFIFGLLTAMFLFISRRDWLKASGVTAVFVPIIIFGMALLKTDVEPYISSRQAGEYLIKNSPPDAIILCSKPFVRGVKYYTDREVAAMGNAFFSPHPIELLDSPAKIKSFLNRQNVTYADVKLSDFESIESLIGNDFYLVVARKIGDEYILLIKPVKKN
jgi:4-amino-4-deoxy-L-arabinose transferase-like glycosyltransferase